MKKLLILMLALALCSGTLFSCNKKKSEEPTTDSVTNGGDNGPELDENGYQMDKLGTMDFSGEEIVICGWSNVESSSPEFDVKNLGSDNVSNAAYLKNKAVENRLNVKLKFETMDGWTGPGTATAGQAQITRVQAASGTDEIDLIGTYSWNPCVFMVNGDITNINDMPHVDLSAPWWNQSLTEKSSIYGNVYSVTGDIAPSLISSTYAVFFNKDMVSSYGLEDPYAIHESGDWTLDKMIEMSKAVANDKGEVGKKETTDIFGFVTFGTATDAFYHGSGMMLIENAPDGSMLLSDDFSSSKVHELLRKLVSFDQTTACFIAEKNKSTGDADWHTTIWENGNALFLLEEFSEVSRWMETKARNFGILPMPKYDTNQSEYYTLTGFYHTMYCVPKALAGSEVVGATLECLASESYRRVSPAYYDDLIQGRYAATVKEAMMFDEVRANVVIDSGRIFNQEIGWKIAQQFRINLVNSDTDWVSQIQSLEGNFQTKIGTLNAMANILG